MLDIDQYASAKGHVFRVDPEDRASCVCGLPRTNRAHTCRNAAPDWMPSAQPTDEWDATVIDRAIIETARGGAPFSANEVRPLLPTVRQALVGARFNALARRRFIVGTGRTVASTKAGTHGHRIGEYVAGPRLEAGLA